MSTKPKTTIGPLPYQPVLPGEVIPEQNIASEQALENMMAALERRKQKPFFDPTLLSLAAGFLTPTKTGGFGESLGYAAQNLAGGMDAERKREAENIAFESGVLGQAAAIEQMKRRDKEFARLLGDTGERCLLVLKRLSSKDAASKVSPFPVRRCTPHPAYLQLWAYRSCRPIQIF
jgi:hypothetical protein